MFDVEGLDKTVNNFIFYYKFDQLFDMLFSGHNLDLDATSIGAFQEQLENQYYEIR